MPSEKWTQKLRTSRATDRIIGAVGLCLFALAVLSYFLEPKYEKGAWLGIFAFSNALTGSLSFKFGITIPGANPDGISTGSDAGGPTVTCPQCGYKFDARQGVSS